MENRMLKKESAKRKQKIIMGQKISKCFDNYEIFMSFITQQTRQDL